MKTDCITDRAELPDTNTHRRRIDAVIGLGANLGCPRRAFSGARAQLARHCRIVRSSGLYRTKPIGGPPQPDFLNAALRVSAGLGPRGLLGLLLRIERRLGRVRDERWGPRLLDLDLLWVAGLQVRGPDLTIPHPRLHQRAFALMPLLEVAPSAGPPGVTGTYREALAAVKGQAVTLLTDRW